MKGLQILVLVLALAVVLIGCRDSERHDDGNNPAPPMGAQQDVGAGLTKASAGCGAIVQTGSRVESINADGMARAYRIFVPSSYDRVRPEPLVLNFHGLGGSGASMEAYSRFAEVAEREGFVLVSPDGIGSPPQWHTFGRLLPGYVDDASFVAQMLDQLTATLCIDEARIYATGLSNGGGMAQMLACREERIAAIGVVAAAPFVDAGCADAAVPVIAFHGTADEVVSFEGEGSLLGLRFKPVRNTMSEWAERNGCDGMPRSERVAEDVVRERYEGCNDGSAVELYIVEGGGHTWPGAIDRPGLGRITQSTSASEVIWEFFDAHSGE